MKTPPWLAEEIARQGAGVLDGSVKRASADAAVIATTRKHPEFLDELGAALAVRLLGKWVSEHTSSGDLFQAGLFEDLPAILRVAPQRTAAIADMTGADLDKARNMLWNRTEHQMNGAREAAERERAAFSRLYDRVRPLLADGKTVGDVLAALAAEDAA